MYASAQLKWHVRAWFAISLLLNVLSLSAFIEEVFGWRSWISGILDWYRVVVATILASPGLVRRFVPSMVITVVSQVLVFMGGVFASANFYALKTEGQSVFQRVHETACKRGYLGWLCALRKSTILYLLGPAILAFVLWKALVRRAPTQRILGFTFRPSLVAAYYLSLVGGVTATLALASLA